MSEKMEGLQNDSYFPTVAVVCGKDIHTTLISCKMFEGLEILLLSKGNIYTLPYFMPDFSEGCFSPDMYFLYVCIYTYS